MTAPVVENEQSTEPVEGEPTGSQETPPEVDESKDESKLSDYWRGELTRARSEAGNYRTQLREVQSELTKAKAEAKTIEEYEAAVTAANTRVADLETAYQRSEAARRHNLPNALAARLQGSTAEEIEADAKALAELIPAQATPVVPPRPPRGGLSPESVNPGKKSPAQLAIEVEQANRRRR